jgi:hypothetical protein
MRAWLLEQNPPYPWPTSESLAFCFGRSNANFVRWLLANGFPTPKNDSSDGDDDGWGNVCCLYAIESADLEWLVLLRSMNPPCPWTSRDNHSWERNEWEWAAAKCDVEMLEWMQMHRTMPQDKLTNVCTIAAEHGNIQALEIFRSQDSPCQWDYGTFMEAVAHQHEACVQWLLSNHCPLPTSEHWQSDQSPWQRHVQRVDTLPTTSMLKLLLPLPAPFPWYNNSCSKAYATEGVEGVVWLRAQKPPCPWGDFSCTTPARHGDVRALKILSALNPPCPHDVSTCTAAASEGHLEVLQFLRLALTPPCPWSQETTTAALLGGYLDVPHIS